MATGKPRDLRPAQRKLDIASMNQALVPVSELRMYLAGLTLAGVTEIPAGSFWLEVMRIIREKNDNTT